jgi:phosphoribosylformylglycinamidine (FGAM) synthase-like amidotransferase family enzyme
MKAAVLLFPGLNREGDAMRALEQASGHKPTLVWHAEHELPAGTDLVLVPGGSILFVGTPHTAETLYDTSVNIHCCK